MADFTITGDTKSAVQAVLALQKSIGAVNFALTRMSKGYRAAQDALEAYILEQAQLRISNEAINSAIDTMERKLRGLPPAFDAATAALKRQGDEAQRVVGLMQINAKKEDAIRARSLASMQAQAIAMDRLRTRSQGLSELGAYADDTSRTRSMILAQSQAIAMNQQRTRSLALMQAQAIAMDQQRTRSLAIMQLEAKHIDAQRSLGGVQEQNNKQAQHFLLTWRSIIRVASVQALHLALGQLISLMFRASAGMSEFAIRISEIRTISLGAQYSFDQWGKSIMALSSASGKPVADIAESLYQTISNQIAFGADAIVFMKEAIDLARAAATTTANSVNLLSSAINAFGYSLSDTRELAAVFMKTVELGRLRVDEIANTFGRIAPAAKAMGVSIQELGALMSGMTKLGLPVDEVMTGINQVMLKLMRPSKELSALLRDWGYSSGQAAISAMTLTGVLARLEKEAEASANKMQFLGDIFQEIRAIRSGAAIFDPAFMAQYRSELDKISDSMVDYNRQVAIATEKENSAVQLQKMLEHFKNYLMGNIIKPIMDTIARIGGDDGLTRTFIAARAGLEPLIMLMKGLLSVAEWIGVGLRYWIFALTSFRIAWKIFAIHVAVDTTSNTLKMQMFNQTIKQTAISTAGAANAFTRLGWAIQAALSIGIGIITAIIAEMIAASAQAEMLADQHRDAFAQFVLFHRKAEEEVLKTTEDNAQKRSLIFKKMMQEQSATYLNGMAEIRKILNKIEDYHKELATTAAEATKRVWEDILVTIKSGLEAAKKQVADATQALSQINKELLDAPREERKRKYKANIERLEDKPKLQIQESKDYLETLKTEAETASTTAKKILSKESTDEATKSWDAYISSLTEVHSLMAKIRDASDSRSSDVRSAKASIVELEEKLNLALNARLTLLKELKPLYETNQKTAAQKVKDEETNVREINRLMDDLQKQIKDRPSTDKTPQDPGLRTQTINTLLATLEAKLATLPQDQKDELNAKIKSQLDVMATQDKVTASMTNLDIAAKAYQATVEAQTKHQKELNEKIKEAESTPIEVDKILKDIVPNLKGLLPASTNTTEFAPLVDNIAGLQNQLARAKTTVEREPIALDLQKAVADLSTAIKETEQLVSTPGWKYWYGAGVDSTARYDDRRLTMPSTWSPDPKTMLDSEGKWTGKPRTDMSQAEAPTVQEGLDILKNALERLITAPVEAKKANDQLALDAQNIRTAEAEMKKVEQILSTYSTAMLDTNELQRKMITNLDVLISEIRILISKTPGRASGGLVSGGIAGKDSVLSMLMPGEYIVNSHATQSNLSMLDAINRGSQLPNYTRQRNNSVSIGDINITVNGGSTSQQTVREIGVALQREIRKGTISLT